MNRNSIRSVTSRQSEISVCSLASMGQRSRVRLVGTREILNLARIRLGSRVLDIAAGAGEPALSAAERVGSKGYVLATDLSATRRGYHRNCR
jgi:ubiquinone/menaquinone biosynthesis C-methylase UbiE